MNFSARLTPQKRGILQEVYPEELLKYRLSKKSGYVVKLNGKLFLAETSPGHTLNLVTFKAGLCKTCDKVCQGCSKISNLSLSQQMYLGREFPDAVEHASRMEKYDFIIFAVETFDCKNNMFVVVECENYCKRKDEYDEEQYFCETV